MCKCNAEFLKAENVKTATPVTEWLSEERTALEADFIKKDLEQKFKPSSLSL